jgi:large subunit GTPase 1
VSATPGKTKHFQTILLSDRVMLCDCPGLVFPNFASTKADLVCNGVLPIDELREHTGPVQIVTQRIPKFFLEAVYGISIPTKPIDEGGSGVPTPEELLSAYARARGYMRQGKGLPDESRAARYVLKDYVNSKLLYCHPPPDYPDSPADFNRQLYNINSLPDARRQQILSAIKAKNHLDQLSEDQVNELDLCKELENLKFSQHDPTAVVKTDDMISPESAMLDNEFFADQGSRGHTNLPFHLRKQVAPNSKKHNKKNKKKSKMMAS